MVHKPSVWKRSITVLLILASFGASAQPARADLTSIVGNAGPVLSAAISCTVDVNGKLSNIFKKKTKKNPPTSQDELQIVPTGILKDSVEAMLTQEAAEATANKLKCTNAIQRAAAQVILRQLTLKTITWINNGFKDGEAIFIGDEASFLKNIRNKSIDSFNKAIASDANKELYPFGNMVAKEIANHTSSYFERNAIYSLNNVIAQKHPGDSAADLVKNFEKNFAYGGWEAFGAQFNDENNPIGFSMAAKQNLANRIKDTQYSDAQDIKDQLQRNEGFLDLKKCISSYTNEKETCTKWKTATPGSVIANQLDLALGSSYRQLELGQDLSADITAIFNALANQLVQKGLSSLEGSKNDEEYENNVTYVSNVVVDGVDTSWTNANGGDFDVLTDLPEIIVRENKYIGILEEQNATLKKLIPTIYRLDMCIPGPHPGWESDVEEKLDEFINDEWLLPKNSDQAISQGAKIISFNLDPGGFFKESGKNINVDRRNEKMYAEILAETLGIVVERDFKVNGYDAVASGLQTLLSRYQDAVNRMYKVLPLEAGEAEKEFNSIPQYEQTISQNEDEVDNVDGMLYQLCRLNRRVSALPKNTQTSTGTLPAPQQPMTTRGLISATNAGSATNTGLTIGTQASAICEKIIKGNDPKNGNTREQEIASIKSIFSLISPNLHTDDTVTKAGDVIEQLDTVYDKINQPVVGLIDSCIAITADPDYPGSTTRMPYKQSVYFSGNPDEFTLSNTFLPDYEYGTANVTELPDSYNKRGEVTSTRLTGENIISVWDLFTKITHLPLPSISGISELSPFEKLLGIY